MREWAQCYPGIQRVYVFGSRAKGTARFCSDLDIALVLDEAHGNQLSELIVHRRGWQIELTQALGIVVKDVYLADDPESAAYGPVREHGILVFDREAG